MTTTRFTRRLAAFGAILLLSGAVGAQEPQLSTDRVPGPTSKGCTITTTYLKGNVDNFASPADPTTQSPALAQFLQPLNPAGFDVDQPNHNIGQSFALCSCEICSAKLEIRVRIVSAKDVYPNDGYYVGVAPFTPALTVAKALIWQDGNLNPKTITVNLNPQQLAKLCAANSKFLDVYVQDDTVVDWMRLTITHP